MLLLALACCCLPLHLFGCIPLHVLGSAALCHLPVDAGPCRGQYYRYAFNNALGKCVLFVFGGCRGNGNRFRYLYTCEEKCISSAAENGYEGRSDRLWEEDNMSQRGKKSQTVISTIDRS